MKVMIFHETKDGLTLLGTGQQSWYTEAFTEFRDEEYTFPKEFFMGATLPIKMLWSNFQGQLDFAPTGVFYYIIPPEKETAMT